MIQVFRVCYLSSFSVVSEYISNFLGVTRTSSQPINSAKVLISLGVQRADNTETPEAVSPPGSEEEMGQTVRLA